MSSSQSPRRDPEASVPSTGPPVSSTQPAANCSPPSSTDSADAVPSISACPRGCATQPATTVSQSYPRPALTTVLYTSARPSGSPMQPAAAAAASQSPSVPISADASFSQRRESLDNTDILANKDIHKRNSETQHISVGMEFGSELEAYEYYNAYAKRIGFSVRKEHLWKSAKGVVKRRAFCCSREGWRKKGKQEVKVHRAETRLGCQAGMVVALHINGKYRVTNFQASHNHELETAATTLMLRSHRKSTSSYASAADVIKSLGLASNAALDSISKQARGRGSSGDLLKNHKNYLCTKRMKEMLNCDAGGLLQYFQKKQIEDPPFHYAIQLDEDDLITNVFWSDTRMRLDYERFGDVVCLDMSYKTNNYGRPFATFVGVNHHKQSVIFGAVLLYDETADTFKWLFRTFLKAMSGKQPMTILTDHDQAIAIGVGSELPDTTHRICAWHMYQNTSKHLSHVWNATEKFKKVFEDCVYNYEDEENFLNAWQDMLCTYDLHGDEWLNWLFQEREKWALVYHRDTFTADIVSTQRYESLTNVLKDHLDEKKSMLEFLDNFEKLIEDRRYQEMHADVNMRQSFKRCCVPVKILQEARMSYTPKIYEIFEHQYVMGSDLVFELCDDRRSELMYKVFDDDKHSYKVALTLIDGTVRCRCSCKKFEFVGILCRHIIRIFSCRQIRYIPKEYMLQRWTQDASKLIISKSTNSHTSVADEKRLVSLRYSSLLSNFVKLSMIAAVDKQTYEHVESICIKASQEIDEILKMLSLNDSITINGSNEIQDAPDGNQFDETRNHVQSEGGVVTKQKTAKGARRREEEECSTHRTIEGFEKNTSKKARGHSTAPSICTHMPQNDHQHGYIEATAHCLPIQFAYGLNWDPQVQASISSMRGCQTAPFMYQQSSLSFQGVELGGSQEQEVHTNADLEAPPNATED